jgi:ComF family protein
MQSLAHLPERLRRVGTGVGRGLLDLLLPPGCLSCDAPVDAQHRLCAECFRATAFITEPMCASCGVPFATTAQLSIDRLCPRCELAPPRWRRARAALRYDAQTQRLILPLKHADRPELARSLAPMMARAGNALLREAELLVPVPLHRARLAQRRYNQAALLAAALAHRTGRPALLDALSRLHPTPPLGELSAAERRRLLEGAFAVRPRHADRIAGRQVLLVDDVLTSGATADACAAALLAAGARAVDVLAAARVPDPRLR